MLIGLLSIWDVNEWLYEYYEEPTVVFYWMKMWQMVVWVFWRIYYCSLLNVIMKNGCMSISRAQLLYFIECNCDEFLYEYYEGSIVVLYWTLTIMNGWMKNMKGLLLCYTEC
jgi:hypothetical protein